MTTSTYDVKIEDLPESFRDIAEMIGLASALKLVDMLGGMSLYIPKRESCELEAKCRMIYDDWRCAKSDTVYRDLAQKYAYTEIHIRRIIRERHMAENPQFVQQELF